MMSLSFHGKKRSSNATNHTTPNTVFIVSISGGSTYIFTTCNINAKTNKNAAYTKRYRIATQACHNLTNRVHTPAYNK